MLGHTYRQLKQHEKAIEYYQKVLSINNEVNSQEIQTNRDQKSLERIVNEWCGYCCSFVAGRHKEAIKFYEKAKGIAKQDGAKYQEYRTNQAIGNIFWNIGDFENAKIYYQGAFENAIELGDKHCEGTSYLNLASVSSKKFDYDTAQKGYENALLIFKTEKSDHIQMEKALIGLGIAWFNLGKTRKATELIQRAREINEEEADKDNADFEDQHKNPTANFSSSQRPDAKEDKPSTNDAIFQESEPEYKDGNNVENSHENINSAEQTAPVPLRAPDSCTEEKDLSIQ